MEGCSRYGGHKTGKKSTGVLGGDVTTIEEKVGSGSSYWLGGEGKSKKLYGSL